MLRLLNSEGFTVEWEEREPTMNEFFDHNDMVEREGFGVHRKNFLYMMIFVQKINGKNVQGLSALDKAERFVKAPQKFYFDLVEGFNSKPVTSQDEENAAKNS